MGWKLSPLEPSSGRSRPALHSHVRVAPPRASARVDARFALEGPRGKAAVRYSSIVGLYCNGIADVSVCPSCVPGSPRCLFAFFLPVPPRVWGSDPRDPLTPTKGVIEGVCHRSDLADPLFYTHPF